MGSNYALLEVRLRANEARRVHIRFGDLKTPLINSSVCNDASGELDRRTLRYYFIHFARPIARGVVRFATPVPSSVGGLAWQATNDHELFTFVLFPTRYHRGTRHRGGPMLVFPDHHVFFTTLRHQSFSFLYSMYYGS